MKKEVNVKNKFIYKLQLNLLLYLRKINTFTFIQNINIWKKENKNKFNYNLTKIYIET